jgi:hypothetical protein
MIAQKVYDALRCPKTPILLTTESVEEQQSELFLKERIEIMYILFIYL